MAQSLDLLPLDAIVTHRFGLAHAGEALELSQTDAALKVVIDSEPPMRIAVVGAGRMGRVHLSVLEALPDVEVVAVVDPITPGATHVDVDALLADDLPDGAVVAAPSTRQLGDRVAVARRRSANALREAVRRRPPAEATTVFERSAKTGTPLQIGYWRRFVPALRSLRDRIEAGELGDVLLVRSEQWDARPPPARVPAESGGILIDMGIHELDQIRWLTGQELARPPSPLRPSVWIHPSRATPKASRRCSSSRAAGSPSRRSVAASRPATCAGSRSREQGRQECGSSGRRTPTARSPTRSPRRTRRSSARARRHAAGAGRRCGGALRRPRGGEGSTRVEERSIVSTIRLPPRRRRSSVSSRRSTSNATASGGGSSAAASASSATATSQASARHCSSIRTSSATTRRGTSRRWCTPPSRTRGCTIASAHSSARARSAPARPTWSRAPRSRRSTGCRCCSLPGDVFAGHGPDPVLQQLEVPWAGDVSVNDAFRPVSRYFDRISRPEQVIPAALSALRVLTSPADTGAVTLAFPQDVQAEAFDYPEDLFEERTWHVPRQAPDGDSLAAAVDAIRAAQRPLLVAGGGVIYSEATERVARLLRGDRHPGGRDPGRARARCRSTIRPTSVRSGRPARSRRTGSRREPIW